MSKSKRPSMARLVQDKRVNEAADGFGAQPRGMALLKIPHDSDAHLSQLS